MSMKFDIFHRLASADRGLAGLHDVPRAVAVLRCSSITGALAHRGHVASGVGPRRSSRGKFQIDAIHKLPMLQ